MSVLDTKQLIELAERIRIAVAQQHQDGISGDDAMAIADGLNDIVMSAQNISKLAQVILETESSRENLSTILEIGLELKHINYHIDDMKFYHNLTQE